MSIINHGKEVYESASEPTGSIAKRYVSKYAVERKAYERKLNA